MNALALFILAFVVLGGLIFVVMVAGRRKKTPEGPKSIAPGSPETPVSGVATDPKKHKG